MRFTTANFTFANGKLIADCSDLQIKKLPAEITVTSTHTGRSVTYTRNVQKEIENEFFDGEEFHYITQDNVKAKELVLLND